MSKIKLLKDVIEDMESLTQSLNALALTLEDDEEEVPAIVVPKKKDPKPPTLSEVRAILAKKSQAGFTKSIKALLQKYGAEKLSAMDEKYYQALMKDVEELKK